MNGENSPKIGARFDALGGHERESAERDSEAQAARWAQALAPHVVAQLPALPALAETPGGWRASDETLTPQAAQSAQGEAMGAAGEGQEQSAPSRVILNVQTRDLGRVSLVLERDRGSVRVVIGVSEASAIERMLPEREALARQLQGSGLSVHSIQIVNQSELGTVLAPRGFVGKARAFAAPSQAPEEDKDRRRGSRKLNLVG